MSKKSTAKKSPAKKPAAAHIQQELAPAPEAGGAEAVTGEPLPPAVAEIVAPPPALPATPPPLKRPTRVPGVCTLTELRALLEAVGLPRTEKSSDHYGDIKGPRLVVPRVDQVRRLYVYQMPEASGLPGYRDPVARKAEGLGKVTHVIDPATMDEVRAVVAAVAEANGIIVERPSVLAAAPGVDDNVVPAAASVGPAHGPQGRPTPTPAAATAQSQAKAGA